MAAFMALCAMVFFCSSLASVSTDQTGSSKSESVDTDVLHRGQRFGDTDVSTVGDQKHDHVLHYGDSEVTPANLFEETEDANRESNSMAQSPLGELELQSQPTDVRSKTESPGVKLVPLTNISSLAVLDEGYNSDINRTWSTLEPTKNIHDLNSLFNLTENTNSQLDSIQSLLASASKEASNFTSAEVAMKRLPKAIIIGAKKAGTRALLEFLRLHPNVEGTGPEPHFFDRNYDKGLQWYR